MERRIITTDVLEEDVKIEGSLRPQRLDDYIGQEKTKKNLKVYIEAAKQRSDVLDHVLFYGPPGLGKTTLAGIIANEMGTHMKVTSGPAIEKPGEMAAILNNLQEGDVLFVDEIHRLNRQVEEVLYPAMEDFAIDIMIGKGSSARSIRLDLPKFTLVGATTRAGLLTAPLRDRFGVIHHLEFYTEEELANIILHSSKVLNVEVDPQGALEMARRSRGTPRLANRILKRVRDFAQVKYDGRITKEVASFALDLLEVDRYGLDQTDRLLLTTIMEKFQGGPVGLDTLAIDTMQEKIKDLDYDVVVGPESRGFIFGTPIAYNNHKPFVLIRKKGKLPRETVSATYDLEYGSATIEMHKDSIKPGQKVLIVDDLIATGGTTEAMIKLIESLGGEVAGVVVLIELAGLKGRERINKYRLESAICYEGK